MSEDYDKLGMIVPEGWRFLEYDEKINQMIIKRTKNMASLKWEEGDQLSGFYVSSNGEVMDTHELDHTADLRRNEKGVNIFKTSKQAYAANALAMLSQQLDRANEGWTREVATNCHIYSITYPNSGDDDFIVSLDTYYNRFLSFKNKEIAEEFLKTNIELIKQASVFLT